MRKSMLYVALLSAGIALPSLVMAEDAAPAAPAAAAEPASPFAYNIGLYSQYIFRGLTQTGEDLALQGGVDYTHASGLYAGAWASNISWLEDASAYDNSSLELDLYGGYRSEFGKTGIGYDIGLLQYVYPGDNKPGIKSAETTEIYGALSYKWLQGKVSVIVSNGAWGTKDAAGTYYAELNANIPVAETGITANLHVGRQEYDLNGTDTLSYTDWKIGATKSFSNGINVGGYYTDTNGKTAGYGPAVYKGGNIADSQFTVFVQKTF